MKKIISLLLATAVIFCMGITSFASNSAPFVFDGNKEITVGSGTEEVVINMAVDLDADTSMSILSINFDFGGAKGISVKGIDASGFTYLPLNSGYTDAASGIFYYMKDDASGVDVPAGKYNFPVTFTVDNTVETDYTVTLTTDTMIVDGAGENPINDLETYPTATISVKAAAPAVKTVTKSDYKIVESATIVDGKTTDTQIGAAVGIKFTAPVGVTLLPKMIWAVETSAGRKYSKAVPVDLSAVDGTITVAATFHNGIHENSFGVAKVDPLTITEVDAIFTDGTDDYFTNAADEGKKAVSAE